MRLHGKRWPTRVRLDGLTWSIHYVPEGHEKLRSDSGDPDEHLMGACVEWERAVFVCRTLAPETLRDTVGHELAHGLVRTSSGIPGSEPITDDPEAAEEALVKFVMRVHWILTENGL